jgi:hypothetical protein
VNEGVDPTTQSKGDSLLFCAVDCRASLLNDRHYQKEHPQH